MGGTVSTESASDTTRFFSGVFGGPAILVDLGYWAFMRAARSRCLHCSWIHRFKWISSTWPTWLIFNICIVKKTCGACHPHFLPEPSCQKQREGKKKEESAERWGCQQERPWKPGWQRLLFATIPVILCMCLVWGNCGLCHVHSPQDFILGGDTQSAPYPEATG